MIWFAYSYSVTAQPGIAMAERLKVQVVTYGTPYPPNSGARIRDYNLLRQLSRSVTLYLCILVTEASPPDLSELHKFCAKIVAVPAKSRTPGQTLVHSVRCWASGKPLATHPYFYPEMALAIRSIINDEDVDILQIEHSLLAAYRDAVPEGARCRTILSLHNVGARQYGSMAKIGSLGLAKLAYHFKSFLIARAEARSLARFDHCLVVSDDEARWLEPALSAGKLSLVENGVDCASMQPLAEPMVGDELLFIGVIGYPPNSDAVLYFCKSILPIIRRVVPEIRLMLVGDAPPAEIRALASAADIVVTGAVDDPVPYYARARVCVVPLRAGGGTRLKILEAMALGRPVVTTSIGCEGLAVADGEHLLIGDTPDAFAQSVIRVLRDAPLRERITIAARRLVEERYDWPIIASKLLRIYHALAAGEAVPR
jgi:glycosyltransferase involved in cell wall biosynthesis